MTTLRLALLASLLNLLVLAPSAAADGGLECVDDPLGAGTDCLSDSDERRYEEGYPCVAFDIGVPPNVYLTECGPLGDI